MSLSTGDHRRINEAERKVRVPLHQVANAGEIMPAIVTNEFSRFQVQEQSLHCYWWQPVFDKIGEFSEEAYRDNQLTRFGSQDRMHSMIVAISHVQHGKDC